RRHLYLCVKTTKTTSLSVCKMSKTSYDSKNVENLDTFSSVRRPKHSGVIWKKKGSYNTSNVDLTSVSLSKLNENVKRYSHKDLLLCNNSHLGETSSAYVCNDALNVSCNSRMCDSFDENNLFIFDDKSVRISPVTKMPFRKKLRDSMNVRSKSNLNKSLHRTMHKWLSKMQPLAEPVAKWIPRVKHQIDKISKTPNVFGVLFITDCLDLSLDHRFRMFKAYDGKASSSQSWLWHQRLSHLNFATINNLVKNNLVQGLLKMKFKKDHLCFACKQGKIHRKHNKSKTDFASNKPLYLLHMDLCGPKRVESINGKRYVLVVVDDYSRYTWVFFLHSKDEASEVIISFIKKTQVNLHLQVQQPVNVAEALRDVDWVSAMQEELDQFARLKVWRLVPRSEGKTIIKTKWIFKNKKDKSSLVIRNKARLVAVGFVSKQYQDHVYALYKALYGLKQAPRAWYDVLLQFLINSGFQKVPTPMVEQAKLKLDLVGKPVDHTDYRSMIGSLMYVTSSRMSLRSKSRI
nr:ribonuclease H-like domain-containing protein [Tanacetum cinerariifolium]